MAQPRSALMRFFEELRRRHVFRVSAAYLAAAFVLMQAAELILPAVGLAEWTVNLVIILLLLGFPLAVALAWAFDLSPDGVVRTRMAEAVAEEAPAPAPAPATPALAPVTPIDRSIAVLPFTDLSGNEANRYFSDGITEDIIARLCRLRDLKVISRTSVMVYRDRPKNLREIAHELGVRSVLEGSVRRAGERVRIVAQLIDADTDTHLWAETYDRDLEDILAIQSDVAQHIAGALATELAPPVLTAPDQNVDVDTWDLYLRGRHAFNQRSDAGLGESLRLLESCVDRAPRFALGWAALADTNIALGTYSARPPRGVLPAALAAANRALELDAGLPEALAARGCARSIYAYDWEDGAQDFLRAAEAGPQYAIGPHWYALHNLVPRRRFEEAHAHLRSALTLDPLSGAIRAGTAFVRCLQRDWETARAELGAIVRDLPHFSLGHLFLGMVDTETGNVEGALRHCDRAAALRGESPEVLGVRARALALGGRVTEARAILDDLLRMRAVRYVSPTRVAQVLTALNDIGGALEALAEAHDERAVELIWIESLPAFDPLRDERPFRDLVARMGLSAS